MVNKEELLLTAIGLAEGHERCFTDIDLSNKLNISRGEINNKIETDGDLCDFLEKISKTKIVCNSCENEVEVFPGLEKAYCKCGNTIEEHDIPYWDYEINNKEIEKYFIDKLTGVFDKTDTNNNKVILKVKDKLISILITTHEARLDDYFQLRGWSIGSDFYVIISDFYDHLLSSHQDKTNDLSLMNFAILLKKDIREIFHGLIPLIEEREEEKKILLRLGPERKDLRKIQIYWEKIIDELPDFAIQAGTDNATIQGTRFENHIINLLGLTIFDARHIGGQNNTDGIIVVYYHSQRKHNILYPVEVKSFKPKDGKMFYRLKEHEHQLRKYLDAYTSDTIIRHFTVKSMLVIAYDFDLENETDQNVIKRIKKDYNVDIILMPLRSLIRIVRLYFEKQISSIYPDIIEELLSHQYITENDVGKTIDDLKKRLDSESDHIIKSTKESIKRSP